MNTGKYKRVHRDNNVNNISVTDDANINKLINNVTQVAFINDPTPTPIPNNVSSLVSLTGDNTPGEFSLANTTGKNGQILYIVNNTAIPRNIQPMDEGINNGYSASFIYIDKWCPMKFV